MHERARQGIGYLPQEASIFRRLTVYENLMAVLEIRKDLTAEQRRERADELLMSSILVIFVIAWDNRFLVVNVVE